jgi:hypothetical protein
MSVTRYLEFDSTYRNRNQYPNPSQFIAEISQSGQQSKETARDPISEASPILSWNNSFNEKTASSSVAISLPISTTPDTLRSDSNIFIIQATSGTLRTIGNYYNNCVIQLTNTATSPLTVLTRINFYKFLGTYSTGGSSVDNAEVIVDTALPTNFTNSSITASGNIYNPGNNTNTAVIPQIFIPSGSGIDNFYANYTIQNINTGVTRTITAYNGNTSLATLSSITPTDWTTSTNYNFVIRNSTVSSSGTVVAYFSTYNVLGLANTESVISGSNNGNFVRFTSPFPTNTPGYSTIVSPYGYEAKIVKYTASVGKIVTIIGTSFTLDSTAVNQDNYYVGCIISSGSSYGQITSYVGSTYSCTVNSWTGGTPVAGSNYYINSAFLAGSTLSNITNGSTTYELEQFSRDNWTPFSYSGSLVSSQETICYEVELINLILPNSTIESGRGGRAIFYPYMYVELQQISSTGGVHRGTIYSNNPNAYKMLFRAVVDDTTQPVYSPFIKIDSNSMSHAIKFKPNDSFLFSVYTPGGTLFQTVAKDFYSPTEPNPLVQISACFSFKRLPSS